MSAASDYLENEILDHTLGTGAYTMPSTVYIALYTTNPTDADSGTEVSGGSYARQSITFGAASGGSASNDAVVEFPEATASWGTITHWGIRDAVSGGNLLYHAAASSSVTVNSGETLSIPIGNITVSAD